MHTESLSQENQSKADKFFKPTRSDKIKHRTCQSYNEDNILDDYFMCAQSIVYRIPTAYDEIKNS